MHAKPGALPRAGILRAVGAGTKNISTENSTARDRTVNSWSTMPSAMFNPKAQRLTGIRLTANSVANE
jgi:hypothetical protein